MGMKGLIHAGLGIGILMMSSAAASLPAAAASSLAAGRGTARPPLEKVLGISLGMPEERVRRVLARIGHRAEQTGEQKSEEEEDRGLEREYWLLDDRRYGSILVVFDADRRLRALQAYLRPGGRGLRYREIGNLRLARRLGYTIWQWEVPPRPGQPGRRVTARGADSIYAGSVAMTALDRASALHP